MEAKSGEHWELRVEVGEALKMNNDHHMSHFSSFFATKLHKRKVEAVE